MLFVETNFILPTPSSMSSASTWGTARASENRGSWGKGGGGIPLPTSDFSCAKDTEHPNSDSEDRRH